jgi:hypothetical protein
VFSQGRLIGEPEYLEPLFLRSIEIIGPGVRLHGKRRAMVQIRNKSPLNFELRLNPKLPDLEVEEKVVLAAGKVSVVSVRSASDAVTGEREVRLPCTVLNLLAAPNRGLKTILPIKLEFGPGR